MHHRHALSGFGPVLALCLGLAGVWIPLPAAGQNQERLRDLERRLQDSRSTEQQLERQEKRLAEEVDSLRRESVRLAGEAQDFEASLIEINRALSRLAADEARTEAALTVARRQYIALLAALQRMARQPRQVLVVRPAGPVDTVRSSMLLKAALPQVQDKAADLKASLDLLARLRSEKRRALDRKSLTAEERERTGRRIEANLALKREQLDEIRSRRAQVLDVIRRDERQAENLRELFARIEQENREAEQRRADAERRAREEAHRRAEAEAAAARERERQTVEASSSGPVASAPPAALKESVDNSGDARSQGAATVTAGVAAPPPKPAPPSSFVDMPKPASLRQFPRSRAGSDLRFPVVGEVVRKFGEKDGSGTPSRGVSLRPIAGARVVAPYDGQVKFSGPFRGYGNMVIIEHTDGYFSVLAGMERIDAVNGDWVLAGEPVGLMPEAAGTVPTLYMELRRHGERLDPLPWLRIRRADAGGGTG